MNCASSPHPHQHRPAHTEHHQAGTASISMVIKGWRVLCRCPLALPMSPVSLPGDVHTCRPFRRPNTSLLSSPLVLVPCFLQALPLPKRLDGAACARALQAAAGACVPGGLAREGGREGGRQWGRATAWLRSAWLRTRGGSGRATVCGELTGRRSSPPPHVMRLVQSRCCPGVTATGR
jgi:hypothetical protein